MGNDKYCGGGEGEGVYWHLLGLFTHWPASSFYRPPRPSKYLGNVTEECGVSTDVATFCRNQNQVLIPLCILSCPILPNVVPRYRY
eukprot:scaffold7331_cov133-Skeletonema_dohrnii-CCMP3373.AAC.1